MAIDSNQAYFCIRKRSSTVILFFSFLHGDKRQKGKLWAYRKSTRVSASATGKADATIRLSDWLRSAELPNPQSFVYFTIDTLHLSHLVRKW